MILKSPAFQDNEKIPVKYTRDGDNINPPLEIADVPSQTQSLVLIVDDPDAPSGTWVHWVVWNIGPKITRIDENSVPSGATQGTTSRENHYSGPYPPSGTHRYFFKLYAIDIMLELDSSAAKVDVLAAMKDHILAQAELIGLYR